MRDKVRIAVALQGESSRNQKRDELDESSRDSCKQDVELTSSSSASSSSAVKMTSLPLTHDFEKSSIDESAVSEIAYQVRQHSPSQQQIRTILKRDDDDDEEADTNSSRRSSISSVSSVLTIWPSLLSHTPQSSFSASCCSAQPSSTHMSLCFTDIDLAEKGLSEVATATAVDTKNGERRDCCGVMIDRRFRRWPTWFFVGVFVLGIGFVVAAGMGFMSA